MKASIYIVAEGVSECGVVRVSWMAGALRVRSPTAGF